MISNLEYGAWKNERVAFCVFLSDKSNRILSYFVASMSPEQAFNKQIEQLVKLQPSSTICQFIKDLQKIFPESTTYYNLCLEVSFKTGIIFKAEATPSGLGPTKYLPKVFVTERNCMHFTPKEIPIGAGALLENSCYKKLAKEYIYYLNSIPGLLEKLKKNS